MSNLKGLRYVDARDVVIERNMQRELEARWPHDVAAGLDDCPLRTHGLYARRRVGIGGAGSAGDWTEALHLTNDRWPRPIDIQYQHKAAFIVRPG